MIQHSSLLMYKKIHYNHVVLSLDGILGASLRELAESQRKLARQQSPRLATY